MAIFIHDRIDSNFYPPAKLLRWDFFAFQLIRTKILFAALNFGDANGLTRFVKHAFVVRSEALGEKNLFENRDFSA